MARFAAPLFVWSLKFITDGTAEVMMQPVRFRILQYLRQSREPRFVEQIAKAVGIHPRLVSHHLDVLKEQGLVESRYELMKAEGSKRSVAVRMCVATSLADKAIQDIVESSKVG